MTSILINGKDQTDIHVADRGLSYGDGLFETLLVKHQKPLYWQRHMQRLHRGCEQLQIPRPDWEDLSAQALRLCQTVPERAVLKIIYTRGSGGRGYRLPTLTQPTCIMALHPAPNYPESYRQTGVKVKICATRLAKQPLLAGLKHLNRLEQVLARAEWQEDEFNEGLMLDYDGYVIEGIMTNVFLIKDGRLNTPTIDNCGVAGIMRDLIIECAGQASIEIKTKAITLNELFAANELFVCNSIIGIWPIHQIEDKIFAVGPITRHLQQAIAELNR